MLIGSLIKNILIRISGIFINSRKSRCIFYHDIHSDVRFTEMSNSVELFIEHVKTIRSNGFEIVHNITKEDNQISISFDDGWRGVYENIEIINTLRIPITIFVIPSFLNQENFLSEKELVELSKNPYIKIQSHTLNHFDLTSISVDVLKEELIYSKNIIESLCGSLVDSVCYPKGLFNSKIVDIANDLGYRYQYSSLPGSYCKEIFPSVKRRTLVQYISTKQLKYILRGGDSILYFWYKLKHIKK